MGVERFQPLLMLAVRLVGNKIRNLTNDLGTDSKSQIFEKEKALLPVLLHSGCNYASWN